MKIRKAGFALIGLGGVLLLSLTAMASTPQTTSEQSERSIAVIHADENIAVPFHSARIGGVADDIIRITPNKSKIIRLERDAASVVVSNPTHASILLDTPRVLVIIPRAPGATSFTVLDSRGNLVLERDVVVTGSETNYINVRRICGGNDAGCMPQSVYFCPDACYEVATEGVEAVSGGGVSGDAGDLAATGSGDGGVTTTTTDPNGDAGE